MQSLRDSSAQTIALVTDCNIQVPANFVDKISKRIDAERNPQIHQGRQAPRHLAPSDHMAAGQTPIMDASLTQEERDRVTHPAASNQAQEAIVGSHGTPTPTMTTKVKGKTKNPEDNLRWERQLVKAVRIAVVQLWEVARDGPAFHGRVQHRGDSACTSFSHGGGLPSVVYSHVGVPKRRGDPTDAPTGYAWEPPFEREMFPTVEPSEFPANIRLAYIQWTNGQGGLTVVSFGPWERKPVSKIAAAGSRDRRIVDYVTMCCLDPIDPSDARRCLREMCRVGWLRLDLPEST
ncbi:unnamed protein product [Symbiodinium sp. CCMP2592]|nr:unnamed protein product [Symbiodinium sp. CCMP2592]